MKYTVEMIMDPNFEIRKMQGISEENAKELLTTLWDSSYGLMDPEYTLNLLCRIKELSEKCKTEGYYFADRIHLVACERIGDTYMRLQKYADAEDIYKESLKQRKIQYDNTADPVMGCKLAADYLKLGFAYYENGDNKDNKIEEKCFIEALMLFLLLDTEETPWFALKEKDYLWGNSGGMVEMNCLFLQWGNAAWHHREKLYSYKPSLKQGVHLFKTGWRMSKGFEYMHDLEMARIAFKKLLMNSEKCKEDGFAIADLFFAVAKEGIGDTFLNEIMRSTQIGTSSQFRESMSYYNDAIAGYRKFLANYQDSLTDQHVFTIMWRLAKIEYKIAQLYEEYLDEEDTQEQLGKAIEQFKESQKLCEGREPNQASCMQEHFNLILLLKLADLYLEDKNYDKAYSYYEKIISIITGCLDNNHSTETWKILYAYKKMGVISELRNDIRKSESHYKKAEEVFLEINNPRRIEIKEMADIYRLQGRMAWEDNPDQAVDMFLREFMLKEELLDSGTYEEAVALQINYHNLAVSLIDSYGNKFEDEAKLFEQRSREIKQALSCFVFC